MRLAALFGNRAVLQRDMVIPVWGWTEPFSLVRVCLGDNSARAVSGADGKFMVRLAPMAAGGPYTLEAVAVKSGAKATAEDVMVGEVWVASGQSNMEFTFDQLNIKDINPLNNHNVRMITVPRTADQMRKQDFAGEWLLGDSDELKYFSAVAFHFADKLQKELGMTIGVISAAWGGTIIEAWTSRETLIRNPEMTGRVKRYEADVNNEAFWGKYEFEDMSDLYSLRNKVVSQENYPQDPGNIGEEMGWAAPDFDDSAWELMKLPSSWKLQGVPYNGSLWFRLQLNVPASWGGKDLLVNIGAVDKHDVTYFNGERIGANGKDFEEQFWNVPREYKIPGRLVKPGKNTIAVRAFSFLFDGGLIGPAKVMRIAPEGRPEEAISLTGKWRYAVEHNVGNIGAVIMQPGPGNPNTPYILFDNMIYPLLPYAMRGAIWYQGESNEQNHAQYRRLMADMICDWRHAWGQGDFQFLLVQLANFRDQMDFSETSLWPYVREAQMQALELPNTGMAVTLDIGEALDIHPKNKLDVGHRLAYWALRDSYHRNIVASGPIYRDMVIENNRIRLFFNNIGNGLVAKDGELKTFMISDSSKNFLPAVAFIEGNSVVVSSSEVEKPAAVRYAWSDNPEGCNLYNAEGLPASSFRTDTW